MNDRGAQQEPQAAWALSDAVPVPPLRMPVAYAVPNVSEGRDRATIDALVDACRVPGMRVLDVHSDADHHRSVITIAGDPWALQDALVSLAGECIDRIDLRRHRGAHPRVGALDVAPIVALDEEDLPLAAEIAAGLAERLGNELNLPVFLYGDELSTDPDRTRPFDFRRQGMLWLEEEVTEGRIVPDAGPPRMHPSAGAVLVSARLPLVAWNVWLPEGSLTEARAIAARVREAGGGLRGLRALGLYLADAGAAQVSMNLEDYRVTPPYAAVAAVRDVASRLGIEAGDSELVGLIPRRALAYGPSPSALGLRGFRPGQLLEARMPPALRRVA